MAISDGDIVVFSFSLTLDDGIPVDASGETPWSVAIGRGELAKFLECRLRGLERGDRRRFEIPPGETVQDNAGDAVQRMSRGDFSANLDLKQGSIIGFDLPNGEEVAGTVVEVTDDEVVVDFTHPLSGRGLVFEVEILDVKPAAT